MLLILAIVASGCKTTETTSSYAWTFDPAVENFYQNNAGKDYSIKRVKEFGFEGLKFDLRHGDYTTQSWCEKVERNELDASKGGLFKGAVATSNLKHY